MNSPKNIDENIVPEEFSSKEERLISLAQEHNVLRISAEQGMSIDEAISVIEHYSDLIEEKSLSDDQVALLT